MSCSAAAGTGTRSSGPTPRPCARKTTSWSASRRACAGTAACGPLESLPTHLDASERAHTHVLLGIDDDFAKNLGLSDLAQLKGLLRGQLEQELAGLTRTQMKRALLDQLAAGHDFEVPPSMVEAEFGQIWQQLTQEASQEEDSAAALKEIEAEKGDYEAIAVRRVRLGLQTPPIFEPST